MNLVDQIKTTQGLIPVQGATLSHRKGADEAVLSFEVAGSHDASAAEGSPHHARRDLCLESLAFANDKTLLSIAGRIGPLFGMSLEESVFDWQAAVSIAREAVQIQEVANGLKPVRILEPRSGTAAPGVAKVHVRANGTKEEFDVYALSAPFRPSGESVYAQSLPPLPYIERFGGSCFDYAVISVESDRSAQYLTVTLLSFQSELSARDFSEMLKSCCGIYVDPTDAQRLFGRSGGDKLVGSSSLSFSEMALSEGDREKLGRMVQAIASLHLSSVRVDVFRSQERDDFLLFESALSYLWYRFAKNLGHVKIGYCQQCGKAFSLAGHRGVARRYCSEECRTKAKNQRTKEARDRARSLFLQGTSIEDIAQEVYPQLVPRFGESRVRSDLGTWPALKEKARCARNEGDAAFLERLKQAGIGADATYF